MISALALTFLLAFTPASRAWQDGMLTDVTRQNSLAQIIEPEIQTGTGDRTIRYTVTYRYTIQTADKSYSAEMEASEQGNAAPIAASPIDLDTNAHLSFAIEKQTLYLKDKKGKEHKLRLVKQTPLPASPQNSED